MEMSFVVVVVGRFRRNQCVRHKDELLIFQSSCCHPSIISRGSLPRTNTLQKELHFRFALNGVIAVTRAVIRPLAHFNFRLLFFFHGIYFAISLKHAQSMTLSARNLERLYK